MIMINTLIFNGFMNSSVLYNELIIIDRKIKFYLQYPQVPNDLRFDHPDIF